MEHTKKARLLFGWVSYSHLSSDMWWRHFASLDTNARFEFHCDVVLVKCEISMETVCNSKRTIAWFFCMHWLNWMSLAKIYH